MVKQVPEEHLKAVRFCPPAQNYINPHYFKCGYRITALRLVANQSIGVRLPLPAQKLF